MHVGMRPSQRAPAGVKTQWPDFAIQLRRGDFPATKKVIAVAENARSISSSKVI